MMRRVTMLGIAALILLHPTGNAHAGLFGGGRADDAEDRPPERASERLPDREFDRGYDRAPGGAPEDESPRSPHGMRVREVSRRPRGEDLDDAAPPRITARDSNRGSRDVSRDEELPRSARRRAESRVEDGLEREGQGFDKKMQDLHRQLEEAEQAENPRKIKAIKWMIQKEEERHDGALQASARQTPARAKRTGPAYEPPERPEVDDRSEDRGTSYRAAGSDRGQVEDRTDTRSPSRRPYEDEEPRRDERPSRMARAPRRDEPEVSNPLRERSRRQAEDAGSRSRGRADRDEDEQDGPASRGGRAPGNRYSNAARIARAEGGIRRY